MLSVTKKKWVSIMLVWIMAFSGFLVLVPMASAATYSGSSGLAPSTVTNTVYYNTTLNGGFGQPGNAYWWGQNFSGTASISSSVNSTAYSANLSISSANGYTEDAGGSSGTYFKFSYAAYVQDGTSGPLYSWFSNDEFGNAYGDYQIQNAQFNSVYAPPVLVYLNITNGILPGSQVLGTWQASDSDWGIGTGYQYLTLNPTWYLSQAGVGGLAGGNASAFLGYNITVIYEYSSSATLTTNPAMLDTFANAASGVNNETNSYASPAQIFFGYGFTNPAGAIPISQASATYPISLSGVPSGTGYYQQLLTIDNPAQYGINTAGSNIQFTAGNGTLLYAWIQSINSTSMQVWVKNYNSSSTIDMQVLPSFENLFSATGYLGEAPQISSVYGEYFNAPEVFGNDTSPNAWDFAGTTLPSGWSIFSPNSSYNPIIINNGLIITGNPVSIGGYGIYLNYSFHEPIQFNVYQKLVSNSYSWGKQGIGLVNTSKIPGILVSLDQFMTISSSATGWYDSGFTGYTNSNGSGTVSFQYVIPKNVYSLIGVDLVNQIKSAGYLNNSLMATNSSNYEFTSSSVPATPFILSDSNAPPYNIYYAFISTPLTSMPTFTIGAGIGTAIQENVFTSVKTPDTPVAYTPFMKMTAGSSVYTDSSTGFGPTQEMQYISSSYTSGAAPSSIQYQILPGVFEPSVSVDWNSTEYVYNPVAPATYSLTQTITESGNWWNSTFTVSVTYTPPSGAFIIQKPFQPSNGNNFVSSATFNMTHVEIPNTFSPYYYAYDQQSAPYGSIVDTALTSIRPGLIMSGTNPDSVNPASVSPVFLPDSSASNIFLVQSPDAFVMLHSVTLSDTVSVESFSNFYPVWVNDAASRTTVVPGQPVTFYANVTEVIPGERQWASIALGDGQIYNTSISSGTSFAVPVTFDQIGTFTPIMTVYNDPSGSSLYSTNTSLSSSFDLPAVDVTGYTIIANPKAGSRIPAMATTVFTANATTTAGDSFSVEKLYINGALTDEWNKAGQAVDLNYSWHSFTPEILDLQWYFQSTYYHETVYLNYTANLIPASNTSAVGVEFSSNITRYANISRLPAMEKNTSSQFIFPSSILNDNYTTQKDVYSIEIPPGVNYAEVFLNVSWLLYYAYPSEETYYHYNWTNAILFSNISGFSQIQVVALELTNLIGSPSLVSITYEEHGQSLPSTEFTASVQWQNYSQVKENEMQLSSPYVQLPYGARATVTVYDLWGQKVGSQSFSVFNASMSVSVPLDVSQLTFTFVNASQTNALYVEANNVNMTVTGDYAVVANNTYVNWTTTIYSFVIGTTRTYHGEVHPESFTQQVFINGQAPPAYVTFQVDAYPSSNAGALGNTGPSATAQTLEALLFIDGAKFPIGSTYEGVMGQSYNVRVADVLNQTLYENNMTLTAPQSTNVLTVQKPSWIFQITNNEQIANLSSPLATETITVSNNTTSKPVYTAVSGLSTAPGSVPPSFSFTASVGQTVAVYLKQENYSVYLHDNATFLTTVGLFGNAYFHVLGQELLTQQQYDRSLRQILNNSAHLQVVAKSAPSTAVPQQPLDYSWGINLPNGTALQANPLQWLLANSSFAVIGNTYPVAKNETGPKYTYVPVTISNPESVDTPVNFQQLLKIDWNTYASYLNANISNVRFYNSSSFSSSTELPGWIETNNTTSATSSNVWVNLEDTIVPASGTATIYMAFLPKTSSWSSHWGLAPTLSTRYGQFDNGANVFTNYWNFAGTTLPTGWSGSGQVVHNGIYTNGSGDYASYSFPAAKDAPFVLDFYGYNDGTGSYSEIGMDNPPTRNAQIMFQESGSGPVFATTNGVNTVLVAVSTVSAFDIYTMEYISTDLAVGTINYGTQYDSTAYIPTSVPAVGMYNHNGGDMFVQWMRTRLYPPDGVMPSASFGTTRTLSPIIVSLTSVVQSNSFVSSPPPLLNTNFSAPQSGTYTVSFESFLLYEGQMYGVTWSSGLTVSQLYNTSQGIAITLVGPSEIQRNVSTAYVIEVDFSGGAPLNSVNATKSILGNLSVSIYYSGNFIGFATPYLISSGKIGFGVNESALGSTYAISAVVKPTMVLGRNVSASAYLPFGVLPYNPSNPPTTQDGIISFLTSEPMLIFYFVATVIGILAYFWPRIPWVARREERKQSMDAVGNTVEGIIALKVSDNQPLTATETVMWNAIPQDLRNDLITRLTSGKIRKYSKRNTNEKKKRLL